MGQLNAALAILRTAVAACGGAALRRSAGEAGPDYTTESTAWRVAGDAPEPVRQRLTAAVRRGARAGGTSLELDGRLSELAGWVLGEITRVDARSDERADLLAGSAVDHEAWRLGLVAPTPSLLVQAHTTLEGLEAKLASERLSAQLSRRPTHMGLAVTEHRGTHLAVLVFVRRDLTLEALPRHIEPGQLRLRGRLREGVHGPVLAITGPDGRVRTARLPETRGLDFAFLLRARGAHQLELIAEGDEGPVILANFPVYVGVRPATRPAPVAVYVPPTETSPEAIMRALVDAIQAEREQGIDNRVDKGWRRSDGASRSAR